MQAQTGKLFDADKQLSSSFTSQVYMDRDGFIWVATRNGLNRYDGYQFQIIKKEHNATLGMASNYVNCMIQDKDGLFYMGMYGALQNFDGNRFQDVEVTDVNGRKVGCYITSFLLRRNGEILAGTSGHGLLRLTDPTHARQVNGSLRNVHTINDLLEDTEGNIWIVTTDQGLLCYDGKKTKAYFSGTDERTTLRRLCMDAAGNIYAGTSNHGAYVLERGTTAFRHLEQTGNRHISALYCRRDGRLMIGYDGQGVALYSPKTGALEDNPYYSHEVSLNKSKVYSIVEDASGNIWLGLLQKGIYMQPGNSMGFNYMGYKLGASNLIGQASVISTIVDSKGRTWIGTDKDGLYCLDNEHLQLIKHYKEAFPATVMSIGEDASGRIWVGSYGEGFGYIDPQGSSYHKFPQYGNSSVFGIACTPKGDIWLATMGQGLLRIPPTLQPATLNAYTMQADAPDHPQMNSLTNDYISQISLSADKKRLYLATTMGVCCYDIEKDSWTSTFGKNCLNYGTPCRVAVELGGRLWIGTNDGLLCYDQLKKKLTSYTADDGLADNGIAAIEQDHKGRLWVATDHGLCCYDPQTGRTRSFFVDNGLQSNEFSDGASFVTQSGIMIFGGVGGITWFRPENIGEVEWKAKVRLVSFILNNEPVGSTTLSDGYQVCDTTVIAARSFNLSHSDNTFAMRFSTLTYDNPEHISYLYSINGEPMTRMQAGINELTITHLPPGSYHFSVVAERNGVRTEELKFLVTIHAPWYRTTLAYIVYVLAAIALVWLYLRNLKRKQRDSLRLQEHIHAEEMADAKLRFFMNISHEIRTPMTLVVAPLLSLMKQDKDPQRRSVYETMRRNAERILGLINQMMDLRKIDKGQMQLRMQQTDLVGFVSDIYSLFSQQAKMKNMKFLFDSDADQLIVWIDRDNFDKVVVNILSNAFKFTPPGGTIRITLSHDDTSARIVIYDDGEAIPDDQLEHIFKRFYQVPSSASNNRHTGTGIGLDLTRALVELHHGTITAHNNADGHGCEFVVTIPLGNAHLKEEEMQQTTEDPEPAPVMDNMLNVADEPENTEAPQPLPSFRPSSRQRLVIVEDDVEIRDYLVSEFSGDYDVTGCPDGREGLAEVLRSLPDLVISDIMMPEMDGNTLCTRIKTSPTTSHIPVVLLTAKNRDEDQLQGLETGADAYIVKPFNMDILRRTVVNLLTTHRMLQLKYGRNDKLEEQLDDVYLKSPDERLLERIMNVINKNLNNSDLSVDVIADEVGISRVHLHRKMKELTGQTPHDFIRNIRLKKAAQLLTNQSMNITEVMYACGFSNSASFSTTFKRFYGLSPRDYMSEYGKKPEEMDEEQLQEEQN